MRDDFSFSLSRTNLGVIMKRIVAVFLLFLMVLTSVFALSNSQKIYRVDSKEYEEIKYLYILTGHALPSTTGPWSEGELKDMLDKIDVSTLSGGAKGIYESLSKTLSGEKEETCNDFSMKWGFDAYIETYTHTNTENGEFIGRFNWNYSVLNHKPFLNIKLETWPTSLFYGYAELPIMNYLHTKKDSQPEFGETKLNTNILGLQNLSSFNISLLNLNVPYRAFVAVGGDHWSAQIGRDRMNWGPGVSGNFVVGDNLLYHNMARITAFFDSFKYTFVTSFFPHPSMYANPDSSKWGVVDGGQNKKISGINMFMAHRLEWRFFNDKMNFVLTEAIMYQSEDNYLDLQILNPCMIYHDYYIRSNANSILSFEFDYTPISALNLYAQMVVDEFALPGEPVPGGSSEALPNGLGVMLGANTAFVLNNGVFYASLEGAKTDPYLYLRDNGNREQQKGEYGINWVVAVKNYSEAGTFCDEEFLGYKYGGDAVVANLNAGFRTTSWHVEGNAFFMLHGTHDKWTLWAYENAGEKTETPTSSHRTGNNKDNNANLRNAVSKTLVLGVNGGYDFSNGFEINAQLDFISIWNSGNIKSDKPITDLQLTLGAGYSF